MNGVSDHVTNLRRRDESNNYRAAGIQMRDPLFSRNNLTCVSISVIGYIRLVFFDMNNIVSSKQTQYLRRETQ
jgi:hypothetical protein